MNIISIIIETIHILGDSLDAFKHRVMYSIVCILSIICFMTVSIPMLGEVLDTV